MQKDLYKKISEILLTMGVPAHLKGYLYLRKAIAISYQDYESVYNLNKGIYVEIARECHTTSKRVEKGIRNAIDVAYRRGHKVDIEHTLKYNESEDKNKVTNQELIATISNNLILENM